MFHISFFYLLLYVHTASTISTTKNYMLDAAILMQNWSKMVHLLQQETSMEISYTPLLLGCNGTSSYIKFQVLEQKFRRYKEFIL